MPLSLISGSAQPREEASACIEQLNSPTSIHTVPFEEKILPTGIIILRNYLEIGNGLPYRKNCFQELFGSVIPIKSVMN